MKDELIISLGLQEPEIHNLALGLHQTNVARYEARTLPQWAATFVEEEKEVIEVIGEKGKDLIFYYVTCSYGNNELTYNKH